MEQSKIERINELARKSRVEGLTQEESEEQKALRAEYIAAFRRSLTGQLENIVIVDKDGNRTKPERKKPLS